SGGTWTPTGSLLMPRVDQVATRLTNGQVLITGGCNGTHLGSEGESYDLTTGRLDVSHPMEHARAAPTTKGLFEGQVLVAGGVASLNAYLASAELYAPATGNWTSTGPLNQPREWHTATLLRNGQVLVAGGYSGWDLADAELYDPATGNWSWTGSLNTARNFQTATLLTNSHVLVAGGYSYSGGTPLRDAELYDPASGMWTDATPMTD